MPARHIGAIAALIAGTCCLAAASAGAQGPTAAGGISVAQVIQMLDQAPSNAVARQVLAAYLAGVGEAAGVVVAAAGAACQRPLSLAADDAGRVVKATPAGGAAAATPLIVGDMLARAACRLR
jgi:hypothetical protein